LTPDKFCASLPTDNRSEKAYEPTDRPNGDTNSKEGTMEVYAILRRNGWRSGAELEEAAARSTKVADEQMPDDVRWIRSYVLQEDGGSVGTVCIYEAASVEAIRKHASLADLPVNEIVPIADTVVVRPDPAPAGV
jgi:hypothetical protein